ncbi:MAG: polyisoprenoid-binding protein [Verrucomicrobia bacterium]|nr:polyisoprenoid-binding protein [Verrucomicrobiota bacterium]
MKIRSSFLVLTAILGLAGTASAADTYKIDPVHSSVSFSLRHAVSKFTGSFTKLSGTVTYDAADVSKNSVEATVAIGSVNSGDDKRNAHLLSPDFFDSAKYGTATFKSTKWVKTGADTFDVTGDLTIKGVTKPTVLKVTLLGTGAGMGGSTVSGWEATTVIHKSDFGVNGPAILGKLLGDDVTITLGVEAGFGGKNG